jgi:hypothetical protein
VDDLALRLREFDKSLKDFKAETTPSWQTGEMFNALLTAAQEEFSGDAVVAAISPAVQGKTVPGTRGQMISKTDVGSMRAAVAQILVVLGKQRSGVSVG